METDKKQNEFLLSEYISDPDFFHYLENRLSRPLSNKKKIKLIKKIILNSGKYVTAQNYAGYSIWLSKLISQLKNKHKQSENDAYFSHHDDIREMVMNVLRSATEELKICMYTISDNPIAETILSCHKMGVNVRIITDDGKTFDRGSDIYSLSKRGIDIKIDSYKSLMHHKFVLIDNRKVMTGSYNWTRTGSDINNENILITTNKRIVKAYDQEFDRLWLEMKPLPY